MPIWPKGWLELGIAAALLTTIHVEAFASVQHRRRWDAEWSSSRRRSRYPFHGSSETLGQILRNPLKAVAVPTPLGQDVAKCCVSLMEPTTNCTVILVGCFHGSASSAANVQAILETTHPQVVVLELCAQRYTGLKKSKELPRNDETSRERVDTDRLVGTMRDRGQPQLHFSSTWHHISRLNTRVGLVSALLGAVSGVQSRLWQLQPGLEFTTAIDWAQRQERNEQCGCDVILADQAVDTTLARLAQVPSVATGLWHDFLSYSGDSTDTAGIISSVEDRYAATYGVPAQALHTALWGPRNGTTARFIPWAKRATETRNPATMATSPSVSLLATSPSVSLLSFLTRSRAAMGELVRILAVPFSILLLGNTATAFMDSATMASTSLGESQTAAEYLVGAMEWSAGAGWTMAAWLPLVWNASLLVWAHHALALPLTQVVLCERDDVLANGIRTACRHAKTRSAPKTSPTDIVQGTSNDDDDSAVVVVAILGLLHVNGVAQRLLCPPSPARADETTATLTR
jgi:hypothetical protein